MKKLLLLTTLFVSIYVTAQFTHPGLEFTIDDLEYMKSHKDIEPWKTAYSMLKNDPRAQIDYEMQGPFDFVNREPHVNYGAYTADNMAAFYQAIQYYLTDEEQYAINAIEILDGWATTHNAWGGGTVSIQGFEMLNAAEILRYTYPGWTAQNTANFENYARNMLLDVTYYPYTAKPANQGALQLNLIIRIAVFLNDEQMFEKAIDMYLNDPCAGILNSLPSGINGDTGRDQAHAWMVVDNLSRMADTALSQGVDLYSTLDDRLYHMGEYWFKYNLGYDVVWEPYGTCYGYYETIGEQARGELTSHAQLYEKLYNIYVNKKGYQAPYTKEFRAKNQIHIQTLFFRRESDPTELTSSQYLTEPNAEPETNTGGLTNGVNLGTDKTGTASFSGGVWTIDGSAGDSYGPASSDGGFYQYINLNQNATIIAKFDSHTTTLSNCKGGLMFRESLDANSPMINITSNDFGASTAGSARLAVPQLGGNTALRRDNEAFTIPGWYKISVSGSRVTTYFSANGEDWSPLMCKFFDTSDFYLGLFAASINTSAQSLATFSNVQIKISEECDDYSNIAFERIEAEDFCESNTVTEYSTNNTTYIGNIQSNDWVRYSNVDFSSATPVGFEASVSTLNTAGNFNVVLDNPSSGTTIAQVSYPATGGWTNFTTVTANLTNTGSISDVHDVYLVFQSGVNVNYFEFTDNCDQKNSTLATSVIQAEDYCIMSGVDTYTNGADTFIGNIQNNDWVYFSNIDFGTVLPNSVSLSASTIRDNTNITFRLDNPEDGTIISIAQVTSTGGWYNFQNFSSEATSLYDISGVHDLYLVFDNGVNVDYFNFENNDCFSVSNYVGELTQAEDYCDMSGVQKDLISGSNYEVSNIHSGDWIKFSNYAFSSEGANYLSVLASSDTNGGTLEVRSGSESGTLITQLAIPNTGGWGSYETFEILFNDALITGTHDIYLVFTGSTGYLFNIDEFTFSLDKCPNDYHDAYQKIEAEDFCTSADIRDNGTYIDLIGAGEWAQYSNIDFGTYEPESIEMFVATARATTGFIYVYLDSMAGDAIASVPYVNNNSWTRFVSATADLNTTNISGVHDVYVVFGGGVNLESFTFDYNACSLNTLDAYSTIEAEDYCYGNGVQEYTNADVVFVGNIQSGDYTEYGMVDFGSTSPTYLELVTASRTDANEVEVYLDDVTSSNLIATVPVTNTGSWYEFSTEYISLSENITGTHKVILVYSTGGVNVDSFKFSDGTCYNSTVDAFSTIEAEDYCYGYGVREYTDVTTVYIGHIQTGDYTEYGMVNFTNTSPTYIELVTASLTDANEVQVYIDNVTSNNLIATVPVSNTGSWTVFSTEYISLSESITGTHKVILVYSTGGVNVDSFSFSDGACINQSFVVTNPIEAEDYCEGRGVGIYGGGTRIGSIFDGNWVRYGNVNFGTTGIHAIEIEAGRNHDTNTYVDVYLDDMSSTSIATVTLTNTGGYSSFDSHYAELSSVVTDVHDVYLVFRSDDISVAVADVDKFTFLDNTCAFSSYDITSTIEAEDYCDMYGVQSGAVVSHTNSGDWLRFSGFDFGTEGANVFSFSASSTTSGGTIELRSGSYTGTLLASVDITNTGAWSTYEDFEGNITTPITGVHDLYLVFKNGSGYLFNIDNYMFSYNETLSSSNFKFNDLGLSVYPNPAIDYLNISKSVDSIIVRDLTGRIIIEVNERTNSVNVQKLSSGVYFTEITFEGQVQTMKFLKE